MNPQILPWPVIRRTSLLLAVLTFCCCGLGVIRADVPQITTPANLSYLDVNTAIMPEVPTTSWAPRAPLPTARAGFAIASAFDGTSNKVYVMGGFIDYCVPISVNEAYDTAADSWSTQASIPGTPRWRPSAATLNNIIYVVGGVDDGCDGTASNTVQAFDPTNPTDPWSTKAPMNTARAQVGLGVDTVNNLLYAVGGISDASGNFKALNVVERYDPVTDTWDDSVPDLLTARGFPGVIVVDGKVYVVAGQDQYRAITSAEYYDGTSWHSLNSTEPPPARLNPSYAVLNNKLYVGGGQLARQQSVPLSTFDIYDPVADTWTKGTSLPTSRLTPGLAAVSDPNTVGNVVYAIGGQAPAGKVGEPFTYQILANNNPTSYSATNLPLGLNLDTTRGIISGVPLVSGSNFQVQLSASNADGQGPTKSVNLYIAPQTSSTTGGNLPNTTCVTARGNAGQMFTYRVWASNVSQIAQLAATGLPYAAGVGPELTIDPGTGLISGVVPSTGTAQNFGVQLGLTDGAGVDQSYLELTFVPVLSLLPVITSPSSAPVVLNQFFSYSLTTDQSNTSPVFDYLGLDGGLDDGVLPQGLSFNADNSVISGIYTGGTKPRHIGNSIDTIKKEPPPKIQLFGKNMFGTGTSPLNFLISLHDYEIESLPDTKPAGTTYVVFSDDPNMSGYSGGLLKSANNVGQFVSYTLGIPAAGTYDVKVGIKTDSDEGIFQLSIDGGPPQGSPVDEYSATPGYQVIDVGLVTFAGPENATFLFSVQGKNPSSSDYQIALDYIDLVPYNEFELLTPQSSTAPYYSISDTNLSGGAGTLFAARQVGDQISYTISVPVAGIYNITLGAKTNRNEGMFQLFTDAAIIGTLAPQGYVQDEYSPIVTYGALDLGTVNFNSAGPHIFQFNVTGKNASSSDYHLVLDYIKLVLTSRFEAETLPAKGSPHLIRLADPNFSGQTGVLLNAAAVGDYVTYTVNIPAGGTYDVRLGTRTGPKSGQFHFNLDTTNQTFDLYSPTVGYKVFDLGRYSFTDPASVSFTFTVSGKNESSPGYKLTFDYIDLVR